MTDVDLGDILLAIAGRIDISLEETKIKLNPTRFKKLLQDVEKVLNSEVRGFNIKTPLGKVGYDKKDNQTSIAFLIGELTVKAKDSPKFRDQLRGYLEPQINGILEAINTELLEPAIKKLKQNGKEGLVVIVDNLDRIVNKPKAWGRMQPEYLFIDRGEQVRRLNCHLVYTIPLALRFISEASRLIDKFGNIDTLPMIPVKLRNGNNYEEGINFLRKMVLARAFPQLSESERFERIGEISKVYC